MTTDDLEIAPPSEVWRFLEQVRRRRRRGVRARIAYVGYVIVLAAAVYGGPVVVHVAHSLANARHDPRTTARLLAALPCCLTGLLLLVQLTVVRQATWRGPVLLSRADADWVLPLPLSRRRLLRPRFDAAVMAGVAVAVGAGFIEALVLHGYGLGSLGELTLAGAGGFVLLAVMTVSLAACVERSPDSRRVMAAVTVAVGALAAVTVAVGLAHADGHPAAWPDDVLVWLSPAGWTAQLDDRAAHGRIGYWVVALGLLAMTAAVALARGRTAAVVIPAGELRRRAATAGSMHAAVFVGEFRQARLAVQRTGPDRQQRTRRKPPRRASSSVPWRDLVWLRRSAAAASWTIILVVGAAVTVHVAQTENRRVSGLVAVAVASIVGYLAALQLAEPSRLDADDLRRTRWSPYPTASLARRHTLLPMALLVPTGLVMTAVGAPWLTGRQAATAAAVACLLPPLLAATATLNSYRGRVPLQLMFYGGDLGFGSVGPLLLLAWYLYGPLSAVVGGELIVLPLVSAARHQTPLPTALGVSIVASAMTTTSVLFLAGWRARRLRRTSL